VRGVVLSKVGGGYQVRAEGDVLTASLRGRVKHRDSPKVLVGDRVDLDVSSDGTVTIERVLPRTSVLRRRTPGRTRGTREVVANVDQVVVVGAIREPDWDSQIMDRFLAVAEANGLPAVVVVNKCDLEGAAAACAAPYRDVGYPAVLTSAKSGAGIPELHELLDGSTSVFTGSTGVGKSSLLNVLQPGLQLRTKGVSRRSGTGRHTTVAAEMHPYGRDGFVVDTPGLRDIGLWGLEPGQVASAFPEIRAAGSHCRFDDCRHLEEPGCAVVEAAARGNLAASRLTSYRRLLAESLQAAHHWE
jgi:ribosome biogenesis GTPase